MSYGCDWTCECGWGNLDVRKSCRNCGKANPEFAPATVPEPEAEGEAVAWRWRLKDRADKWRVENWKPRNSTEVLVVEPLYTRPSSEAEIADLRAKLAQARDAGMRDMLNAILALNPEVAAKVARWREPPSPPNPEGKIPFEVALWVTEVATQLGIKSCEEMGEEPLSLAGEEKEPEQ